MFCVILLYTHLSSQDEAIIRKTKIHFYTGHNPSQFNEHADMCLMEVITPAAHQSMNAELQTSTANILILTFIT